MKKIKTFVILLFLVIGMQQSYSQVYKFQTTGYSVLEKDEKGKWGKWSDLQLVNLVVTLDTNKNRIIVYSQEIQLYEILDYQDKEESETDEIYPFTCKDIDGEKFTISIITRKNQDNRKQLYINQKNVIIVYNIVNFPEKSDKQ
ncbi:hypothetical protein [Flavobacterium sp.]|uniref:hypothetical protein n=1 Tax=Flavobacterium sp. TaxID=239 RepID=UPI002B4B157D|nr:hypothetical protein [Flavobacterium sp.]HLF53021.1 hypothetical protein [Flavobacterium sp.]